MDSIDPIPPRKRTMPPDQSPSRASSLMSYTEALDLRAKWRVEPDNSQPSPAINFAVGRVQKIGVMCNLKDQTLPTRSSLQWLDVLLDTGTVENITTEQTLRDYGLYVDVKPYTQPRKFIQWVSNRTKKISVYTDYAQLKISTLAGDKFPIIGEIKLKFKWHDQDGSLLAQKEWETTFKVAATPKNKGYIPNFHFILGTREMSARNMVILPYSIGNERKLYRGRTAILEDKEGTFSEDNGDIT